MYEDCARFRRVRASAIRGGTPSMTTLRNVLLGAAVAMSALMNVPHAQAQAPTTEFQQGLADREAWDNWFNGLSGEYRAGAYFWSGQRDLPKPEWKSCDSLGGEASVGCYAAKAILEISDMRRRLVPAYQQGWNSYATPASQPAPRLQQPTTVSVQQSVPAALRAVSRDGDGMDGSRCTRPPTIRTPTCTPSREPK
jgi:hypothetical protein